MSHKKRFTLCIILAALALLAVATVQAGPPAQYPEALAPPPVTHTVNSTGDGGDATPGDGVCETGSGNGICTLRAAMEEANARTGADAIDFDSSVTTIMPGSALPPLNDTSAGTTIKGNPTWILGSFAGASANGFVLESDANKLQGLLITNFSAHGVWVKGDDNVVGTDGDGANDASEGNAIGSNGGSGVNIYYNATGNWVAGNLIGLTFDGTGDAGNGFHGVKIEPGAHANRIGTDGNGTSDVLERNVISGNDNNGVYMVGAGVNQNVVAGNYIGTNAAGDEAIPNAWSGVLVSGGCVDNFIGTDGDGSADGLEGNVISGNGESGVSLASSSTSTVVAGNTIGTNAAGDEAIPNASYGVRVYGSANNLIGTDGNGRSDGLERNVISGNGSSGITLMYTSTGTVVAGNYIGTNATGDEAIANDDQGVYISNGSTNNLVGTDADGASDDLERNVISGNGSDGVYIQGSDGNVVAGNYIGTNAAGDAAIANGGQGIEITQCSNNRVGGMLAAEGNVISGNDMDGIRLISTASANLVQGNTIGTDASGSGSLGNGDHGVNVSNGSDGNTIGGTTSGAANRIAFNGQVGIRVAGSIYDNSLRRNAVFSNGELGIDLWPEEGVTPNDAGDGDDGPNHLQNYPVLSSATSDGSQIVIQGTLNSSSSTTYGLDFYANGSCDPSGYGEGETYLGTHAVATDGSGDAGFTATFQGAVPVGHHVTATATDQDGNTSEFSQCRVVTDPCEPVQDADFDWAPTTPAVGQQVTFNGEASGFPPITFTWDFGDTATGAGSTVTHTYSAVGTYVVAMTATNPCGTDIVSHTLTVVAEPVCTPVQIVTATADISGCVVSFAADLYGDAPFVYDWDFGDGGTSSLETPDHEYAAAGTYTVTLQVWNCAGQGYDSHTFPVAVEGASLKYKIFLPIVCKNCGG